MICTMMECTKKLLIVFRLCSHNINVGKIVRGINDKEMRGSAFHKKYMYNKLYWTKILGSARLKDYITASSSKLLLWIWRRVGKLLRR